MAKQKMKFYFANKSEEGMVKRILPDKGYGYIEVKDHLDAKFIIKDFPALKEGDQVVFTAEETGEKTLAIKIKLKQEKQKNKIMSSKTELAQKYYLPNDTISLVNEIKKQTNNFSLLMNKFTSFVNMNGNQKAKMNLNNNIISFSMISEISEKQEKAIEKLQLTLLDTFTMKTNWKLVIGLGNESVFETSMTLHHIYGIPYIPSSAIKGIARSWFIKCRIPKDFDLNQEKANDKLEEFIIKNYPEFRDIFGNPQIDDNKEQSGKVIFFDSFPIELPSIVEDIMTPHYSEYYGDKTNTIPPGDYFMPTPINFPVVEDTTFKFYIGIKSNVQKEKAQALLTKASELIKDAFVNYGIGAKTAVGYGYFKWLFHLH